MSSLFNGTSETPNAIQIRELKKKRYKNEKSNTMV